MTLRTIRVLLLPVLLCLGGARPAPFYIPIPLYEMAATADIVVTGKIAKVEKDVFLLDVDRAVAGDVPEARHLRVLKFRDWTCAVRWTPYEKGQRVVLFLKNFHTEVDGKPTVQLRIMSGGGEGEMPIVSELGQDGKPVDQVVIRDPKIKTLGKDEHEVDGTRIVGAKVPLADLLDAVAEFRKSFEVEYDKKNPKMIRRIKETVPAGTMKKLARSSKVAGYMVESAREGEKERAARFARYEQR